MRGSLWVRRLRAGPVAAATSLILGGGTVSSQEPVARAYLEPPEVEVGEQFELKIEVTGVSEVDELILPREFPFARSPSDAPFDFTPSDEVLPYTMEITPTTPQTLGSVTFSYSLVAREAGFFEFEPFRVPADGRMLVTEPVMLFVTPRDPGTATVQARIEPSEVKLMEQFTIHVDAPGADFSMVRTDLPDLSDFAWRGGYGAVVLGRTAYDFVAIKSGTHLVGPFTVRVGGQTYETEPMTLVVSDEHRTIEARVGLNTDRAWVGGEFVLVVEVMGASEFEEEPVLPDVSAFAELQPGMSGGGNRFTINRNFRFRALEPGEFEIGPVTVVAAGQTALTEPVRLTIGEGPPDPVVSPEDLRANVAVDKRRAYVGEPVLVTYQLLSRGDFFSFEGWSVRGDNTFVPPEHEDFRVQDLGRRFSGWERVSVGGRSYRAEAEYLVAVVPKEIGAKTIGPAEFQFQVNRRGPLGGRLSPEDDPTRARMMGEWTPMTLTTDPVVVEVVPLPVEGRPESYRGQVGRVDVASWLNRTEGVVGDTITLRVEITGNAYLRLMPDPEIILPEGLEVSEPEVSDDPRRLLAELSGVRAFVYRVVPTRDGNYRIPAVEVSWFDPETAEYGVSRAEPFDLSIGPAGRE
ncbi:MAG: BatD family protein [Gemmatimonadota bacterium]|nr:BatD family protein [Gemmatimonadota bacterium]